MTLEISHKIAQELAFFLQRPIRQIDLQMGRLDRISGYDLVRISAECLIDVNQQLAAENLILLIAAEENAADRLFEKFLYLEKLTTNVYFCSNYYWYADGNIGAIASSSCPTDFVPNLKENRQTRRYYFNQEYFLKRYQGQLSANQKAELDNEIYILTECRAYLKSAPRLIAHHLSEKESWLLRERVDGTPLNEIIAQNKSYEPFQIIADVLQQLALLERHELYQTDLRTWNVVISHNNEALLVDFGAIKKTTRDVCHKKNVFFSFIMFCYEVINKTISDNMIFNPAYLNVKNYPAGFHGWLHNILSTPFNQWSFNLFWQLFKNPEMLNNQYENYCQRMLYWIDKEEKRYRLLNKTNVHKSFFTQIYSIYFVKFRLRYFEKRYFRYFETHFTEKQFIELIQANIIEWKQSLVNE